MSGFASHVPINRRHSNPKMGRLGVVWDNDGAVEVLLVLFGVIIPDPAPVLFLDGLRSIIEGIELRVYVSSMPPKMFPKLKAVAG